MIVSTARTARELVQENPEAKRVFEKVGIDYCCGGGKSLHEACAAANLSVDEVIDSLELAEEQARTVPGLRQGEVRTHFLAAFHPDGGILAHGRLPLE